MRAGPSRAELAPNCFNRADLFLNSLAEPDHQSFKDPDQIQLMDQLKNSKIFSFFKISYLIINKSYIFNNLHNLSLIFNKNFLILKNFLKITQYYSVLVHRYTVYNGKSIYLPIEMQIKLLGARETIFCKTIFIAKSMLFLQRMYSISF